MERRLALMGRRMESQTRWAAERMPGLILYNRRWSVGSDDCIIPAFILSTTHLVWLAILAPILIVTFTQASDPADSLEVSWEIYLPIRKMREHL